MLAPTMAGASPIVTVIFWTDFSLKSISYLSDFHYLWWRDQERRVVAETAVAFLRNGFFAESGARRSRVSARSSMVAKGLLATVLPAPAPAAGRRQPQPVLVEGPRRDLAPGPRPAVLGRLRQRRQHRGRRLLLRDTLSLAHQYPRISR